jgi:hypothetical protein
LHIGFSGAKRLSKDGERDDSETPTSMVLCNLRIVPEYFCSSGDAHPSIITVGILMCLGVYEESGICVRNHCGAEPPV